MSSVYRKRLQAIRERLRDEALDAMIIQSPINRRYMSGFTGSAGTLVISQHHTWLLVDFRYVEQAKAQVDTIQVERVDKPLEDLGRLLADHQLHRVAFEAGHLTVHEHQRLAEVVNQVRWEPRVDWIETLRGVKDDEEVAAIQKAVDVADAAFEHIVDFLRPGVTEREVALELEFFMRRKGAESLAFPSIVASGPNGALPHAVPSDRRIERGDLVTLDFGCVVDGYCSDITRTVAIGDPDAKSRDLYALVLRAQLAAMEAIQPGVEAREVDRVARDIISEAGYGDYFGHGLGHGLGMNVHEEFPRLSPRGEVVLQPGMVSSVEPGIYIPGWGGIRIEDLVVVTETGCRILTQSSKELMTL